MCKFIEYTAYLQAGDPQSEQETLEALSHSPCAHVRRHVAENPNTALATAVRLMRDESVEVREALTENEQLLPLIAPDLARDRSSDVRFALAENFNTPLPVLQHLLLDENPYIVDRARKTMRKYGAVMWLAA